MFDFDAAELTIDAAARLIAELHGTRVVAECRLLEMAAHWADLHSGPADPSEREVAGERLRTPGGAGTPGVLEFAAAELGAQLETTTYAAWELMGDALDLRHRLPRLWTAVRGGHVRVWKARKVAHATRHLSLEAAGRVDAEIDGLISALSWTRFDNVLTAKITETDPVGEEARAAAYEAERFVRSGRTTEHGLRLVVARAAAGDVIWFLATVTRIAEILAAEGDQDPLDVRRSKAIGILSRPDRALELMRSHSAAPETGVDPEPDPEEDGHLSLGTAPGVVLSPAASRPRVELVVHVSAETLDRDGGPARVEGVGPLVLGQVRRWLAGADCTLSLRPVIDLRAESVPVDAYEIPVWLRRLCGLRMPASVFPYSPASVPVEGQGLDLDHTVPYVPRDRGGPPGQTRLGNLGPLNRSEHRLKTHSGWRVRQPETGVFVWRSPTGHFWLTSPHAGTYPLGSGRLGHGLWRAIASGNFDLAA
jgi:hypothetical protein